MRYLFVHAHPDDETLSSGAIIASLVAAGEICLVLTATRGERGEAVAGSVAAGVDLVAVREQERRAALSALGAEDAGWLGLAPNRAEGLEGRGYRDSGMVWLTADLAGPAPDIGLDSLWAADPDEVCADLVAACGAHQAEVVVSYGPDGGYGHPDHVRCHEAAQRAAAQSGLAFCEIEPDPGLAGRWFDAGEQAAMVLAAHRAYRSQFSLDGCRIVHVGGQTDKVRLATGWRLRA